MFRRIGKFILWCFALLGFVVVVGIVGAAFFASGKKPSLPEKVVIGLDLGHGVVEKAASSPLSLLQGGAAPVSIVDIVAGLNRAAKDKRVQGLVLRMGGENLPMAQAQEIREAVRQFQESGKFAIAFADTIGIANNATVDYYLATAAEEIWLQPSGELALTGLSLEIPFFRKGLEELDIEPMISQRHEYKGAAESLMRTGMSLPVRQSMQALVNSWYGQIVNGIADARKISVEEVRRLIDGGPYVAQEAAEAKLVDKLAYWDELEDTLVQKTGAKDVPWMGFAEYARTARSAPAEGPQVALIVAEGTILTGSADRFDEHVIAGDDLARAIYDVAKNPDFAGLLLRIDSPGGVYMAADTVWRALEYAKSSGKKVVVSMGGAAASGGYFIAMAGHSIVAQPGTITGSIGVYGGKLNLEGFWEKLGIRWETVHIGEHATMWSHNRGYPRGAKERVENLLDTIYADFAGKAAAARSLSPEDMDKLARGRVWTGADAFKGKLIDRLGGLREATLEMKKLLGVDAAKELRVIMTPPPQSPVEQMLDLLSNRMGLSAWLSAILGARETLAWRRTVKPVLRDLADLAPPVGRLHMPVFRLKR